MERFAKYSNFYSIDFFILSQNVENRKRKQPIERKLGITERPRSLNPRKVKAMATCNGSRTEWSPIRSVIIRVITKLGDRALGVRFVYHEYDYRPNWMTRNLITN